MMGYRTPDFVALLASKHLAYPTNETFATKITTLMQPGVTLTRQ
ncbi:MAG: hypothetical protein ACREHG_07755 [Candidatus Saccharimonadales bacterium]